MTPRSDPTRPPLPAPPPPPRVHAPRGEFTPAYVTRKRLDGRELLTAAGAGMALGLACFYLAKVWLERTPVLPPPRPRTTPDGEPEGTVHSTVTPQRAAR